MKFLQAIATSREETLDQRHGIGLVLCSHDLPEVIREFTRASGYSEDSRDDSIYSFLKIATPEAEWTVMNHTMRATGFTMRAGSISHTLAFKSSLLEEMLRNKTFSIISPFEFMLRFKWRKNWDGTPEWMESENDLGVEDLKKYFSLESDDGICPPQGLSAFELSGDSLKPKKLFWKIGTHAPEEALNIFHKAWIAADPWRGTRKYGDHLGEPKISLADSWSCTFATNGMSPKDYQWFIPSPGVPETGSREVIDIAEWKGIDEKAVADQIGGEMGVLLVERSKDPDGWARSVIGQKIADIAKTYRDQIGDKATEKEAQIREMIDEFERTIDGFKLQIENGGERFLSASSLYLKEVEVEIKKIADLGKIENRALDEKFQSEITPLNKLLGEAAPKASGQSHESIWDFRELQSRFDNLKQDCMQIMPHWMALQRMEKSEAELIENQSLLKSEKDKVAKLLVQEVENLRKIENLVAEKSQKAVGNPSLREKKKSRNGNIGWELYALAFVSALVVGLAVIVWLLCQKIDSKEKEISKLSSDLTVADNKNDQSDSEAGRVTTSVPPVAIPDPSVTKTEPSDAGDEGLKRLNEPLKEEGETYKKDNAKKDKEIKELKLPANDGEVGVSE